MNIGIDFDNTIARYDRLFTRVALRLGMIDEEWNGKSKVDLRDSIRRLEGGEKLWMALQGQVYGKFMGGAQLMPGVARFLLQCKARKFTVYIVSHKTQYGHFDPEKVSLRDQALKWMESKFFFDPQCFGIKRENVYFAGTRKEKVAKIGELSCDYFIDDLPEVFAESCFPSGVEKIIFDAACCHPHKPNSIQRLGWEEISKLIMGPVTDKDVLLWACNVLTGGCRDVKQVKGRGNSRVYEVRGQDFTEQYALKAYPDRSLDSRDRLGTEFNAFNFLRGKGVDCVPEPVCKDHDLNLGLFRWVDGETVLHPVKGDLMEMVRFVNTLRRLSYGSDFPVKKLASEACLSGRDLLGQVEGRLRRLEGISHHYPSLKEFLESIFIPVWSGTKNELLNDWPTASKERPLNQEYRILSPSDFGFHNTLKNGDRIIFTDFEYFGWDDPVKLVADFIWHPAMDLGVEMKTKWQKEMLALFEVDPDFRNRFQAAMPLYGFRWIMILLNEFLPGYSQQRKNASQDNRYDIEGAQNIQLAKAKKYINVVNHLIRQSGKTISKQ